MGKFRGYKLVLCYLAAALAIGCAGPDRLTKPLETIPPDESILRIGVSVNAPPLILKNKRQIVGLEADFARELATYLGKKPVFVELNWKDLIPALVANRIDIIMSGMTITDERRMRISFSEPYFISGQMAMIRSVDALRFVTMRQDGRFGYVRGTTGENFIKQYFPRAQKSGFAITEDGVKALINKKIDVLVHDGPIILYLASEYNARGVTPVYNVFTEEFLAWGIRQDNNKLKKKVNAYLEKIKSSGQLDTMIQQWIPLVRRK